MQLGRGVARLLAGAGRSVKTREYCICGSQLQANVFCISTRGRERWGAARMVCWRSAWYGVSCSGMCVLGRPQALQYPNAGLPDLETALLRTLQFIVCELDVRALFVCCRVCAT